MDSARTSLCILTALTIVGCDNNNNGQHTQSLNGKWLWCPTQTSTQEYPSPIAAHTFTFTNGQLIERYEYFSDRECTISAEASHDDPFFQGYPEDFYEYVEHLRAMEDYQPDWGTGEVGDIATDEFLDYSSEEFENYNEYGPFIEGTYKLGSSLTLDSGEEVRELTMIRKKSALIGLPLCYTHVVISGDSLFFGGSCAPPTSENDIAINYHIEYKRIE